MASFSSGVVNISQFGTLFVKANNEVLSLDAPSNPVKRPGRESPSTSLREIATYSDIGLSFMAHPLTGQPPVVKDFDAIKQSMKNIILTNFGERPFSPDFGGGVRERLFDHTNPTITREIEEDIESAILNFEPRVILLDTNVNSEQNTVTIEIRFKIRTIEKEETFKLFLERV